jgi:penicillin-binding protein 2
MKPIRITTAHQSITFSRRMLLLGGAQAGVGGLLIGRLGWLAIAQNEKYQLLSESNRVQLIPVPPRRGWIIDRYGKPIAINKASFRVDLIPQQMDKGRDIVPQVADLLELEPDEVDRIRRELAASRGFQPVSVADNVPYEQYAAITVRLPELPGVAASQGFTRFYPGESTVGQLVGYVGPASVEEYEKENKNPLLLIPGVKIGKEGLEKTLESTLRGEPGGQRVEVTARGKIVKELDPKPDRSGGTVQLTIDSDLHQYAARRIGDQSGSVVVIDLESGDILAMPSMPSFDPNDFSDGISQAEWKMLSDDDHLPLVDKVLESLYPSGSTIKPSMALAFLRQGIDPGRKVMCTGAYRLGNHIFHCDKAHGLLAMHDAIKHSCDIFFYDTGLRANPEETSDLVNYMGYGEKFDLAVPSQRYGTMPSPKWLEQRYHRKWQGYDTINMSIGQGYVLINPMQLAVMASRIGSGKLIQPRLLASTPRRAFPDLAVNPRDLAFVRDAMTAVVNDGGTAAASKLPIDGVLMAGKTGTAQVHKLGDNERGGHENANWKLRDHALFIGFAPADKPRYAIGCCIEHGGFGASAAAPIVRDTMTYLFDKQKALQSLAAYEQSIGGTLDERLARKTAAWRQANGLPPLPPAKQA